MELESQPGFTIDQMTPEDVEEATEMRLQSWLETYPNDEVGVSKEWVEERNQAQRSESKNAARRDRLADPNAAGWVARDRQGKIIGVTNPFTDENGVQHVGSLYVDSHFHGGGVGGALMQRIVDYFDDTKPIELHVVEYNERAKAFYRKWGFVEVENSRSLFDDKIPEVKMVREATS